MTTRDRSSPSGAMIPIPPVLVRHLSSNSGDDTVLGISHYVQRGADLMSPTAIAALRQLRAALQAKIDRVEEAPLRLKERVALLTTYFDETCTEGPPGTAAAHREVAFALLYFLKGFDRIPDTVPEMGLMDDALIVQTVLDRNEPVLREHWIRCRRLWPGI